MCVARTRRRPFLWLSCASTAWLVACAVAPAAVDTTHTFAPTRPASSARTAPSASAQPAAPVLPLDQRQTQLRLRVGGLPPDAPALAGWRQGGEGLGGEV